LFISIVIPSRNRLVDLARCLDSLYRTAEYKEDIEVIIVADSDDPATANYRHSEMNTKTVVVPKGLSMGGLNMAGYRVSVGDYVMLLNDDVVAGTPGWDTKIRFVSEGFPDGIVLIHTNDKIFEDKLCTFPLVSRIFCVFAEGICPEGFLRYRIDDHIYNIFDLLGTLGQRRIIYLPEVVFEHLNRLIGVSGIEAYKPDEDIHKLDTDLFEKLQEERSRLVGQLMGHILKQRTQANDGVWQRRVEVLTDWAGLRRAEYVRHMGIEATLSSENTRVTVGVVSANLMSPMAQRCIDNVKRHTKNFDLVVLDNNGSGNFNHSREMNRLMDMCRTEFLVLMDDDVYVEEGWIDGLLRCIDNNTALVTPCHKNSQGQFSYAGIVMNPDDSGHHTHIFEWPDRPMAVQSICSAVMLIDLNKIGHVKVEEVYQKYFLDVAYGFAVWEAGYRVICTPEVLLTHVGGGTLAHNSESAGTKFEQQRAIFVKSWRDTGRWQRLKSKVWVHEPAILAQLALQAEIDGLIKSNLDLAELKSNALAVAEKLNAYPTLIDYAKQQAIACLQFLSTLEGRRDDLARIQMLLSECFPRYVGEWVVYVYQGKLYGFPQTSPVWHKSRLKDSDVVCLSGQGDKLISHFDVALVEQGYGGHNIIGYAGKLWGAPQSLGVLNITLRSDREKPGILCADSLDDLKCLIRRNAGGRGWPGEHLVSKSFLAGNWLVQRKFRDMLKKSAGLLPVTKRVCRFFANGAIQLSRRNSISKRMIRPIWMRLERSPHTRDTRVVRYLRNALCLLGSKPNYNRHKLVYKQPDLPDRLSTSGQVVIAKENFRDFVIMQCDANFFARPISRVNEPDADVFWGLSVGDVEWSIDNKDPVELFSDLEGFSVSRFEHTYFGIPAKEAPFVYERFLSNGYSVQLNAHSVSQLKIEMERHKKLALGGRLKTLVFGITDHEQLDMLLSTARHGEVFTLLSELPMDMPAGIFEVWASGRPLSDLADAIVAGSNEGIIASLRKGNFDQVVLPIDVDKVWAHSAIERATTQLAGTIELLSKNGKRHALTGKNAHRLIYNKHYLTCLFRHLPLPEGRSVLEVGCGDGLVCEYMVNLGAEQVVGVDVMQTAGCNFPDQRIKYFCRNGQNLSFSDQSFDMVYSIATFEHIPDPKAVFEEILRLVKIGGYFYIQAGPLFHSPFGHHMFNYFPEYPWIHLRKSTDEILRYARMTGAAGRIEEDMAVSAESYINSMLSRRHINGLVLDQYSLDDLRARKDVKEISFSISYEGENLLTSDILSELSDFDPHWLVQHGFEMVGQRIS